MAKTTKNKKSSTQRPRKLRQKQLSSGLDACATNHMRMLYDPCDASLEESVYPGDRGYVNRFVANASYGTGAGATSFMAVIKPGNAVSTNFDSALSATPSVLAFSKAAYPGASFLNANTSKNRAVSFCITVRPIASANNATGTIYFGIVNAQTLANGTSVSPDVLAQYCTNSVSAAQALINPLEIKWCPGGFDDRYGATTALSDDDSDRNVLVVVGTGFPAASGVQYRMTGITEWSPAGTLGIVADATSVSKSNNTISNVTRVLKQKDPNWWWSLGKKTMRLGSTVVGGYAAGGPVGALGAALSYL